MAKLQVVPLAARLGADHHSRREAEGAHRLNSLLDRHAAVVDDRLVAGLGQRGVQRVQGGR